jgi:acyl-CoA thioester hydrolase
MNNVTSKFRVYYEDTDAGGVVYYANFLKFAERSRTDLFRKSGINHTILAEKFGCFYVVRKAEVEYLAPGRLDDEIIVETKVTRIGRSSVDMSQNCFNQHGEKLVNVDVQIVCVKNDGDKIKSAKMPDELKDFFSEYQL